MLYNDGAWLNIRYIFK